MPAVYNTGDCSFSSEVEKFPKNEVFCAKCTKSNIETKIFEVLRKSFPSPYPIVPGFSLKRKGTQKFIVEKEKWS